MTDAVRYEKSFKVERRITYVVNCMYISSLLMVLLIKKVFVYVNDQNQEIDIISLVTSV
jgi:hypothetical protein